MRFASDRERKLPLRHLRKGGGVSRVRKEGEGYPLYRYRHRGEKNHVEKRKREKPEGITPSGVRERENLSILWLNLGK